MIPEPTTDDILHAWLVYKSGNNKTFPLKRRIKYYHEAFSLAVAIDDKSLQILVLTNLAQYSRLLEKRLKRYDQALATALKITNQIEPIFQLLHAISHDYHLPSPQKMHYCTQIPCWAQDKKNISLQSYICYKMGNIALTFLERLQHYKQALKLARASKNTPLEKKIRHIYKKFNKEYQATQHQPALDTIQKSRDLQLHCQFHQALSSLEAATQ